MTYATVQETIEAEDAATDATYERYRTELPRDVARLIDLAKAGTGGSDGAAQVLRVIYAGRAELAIDDLYPLDHENMAAAMRSLEAAARIQAPALSASDREAIGL
ncbi:hypothetical protein [Falsirhodobacter xinxiangensis]|uniref:hypothetical protein n=1 Tax=Falsirhodobacter xinxiangensis TaxID=2530049 RepID=UPI0010AA4380|nr:hypothetical protein [Rhodobacter xinxiangensis]